MNTNRRNQSLSPKIAVATLNILRDREINNLTDLEIQSLILAENIIRENPELAKKYL